MGLPLALTLVLAVGLPVYIICLVVLMFFLWRIYIRVGRTRKDEKDTDKYGLTEEFPPDFLMPNPQQADVRFFHEFFERSARRFPHTCAVRIAGVHVQRVAGDEPSKSSDLTQIQTETSGGSMDDVNVALGLGKGATPLVHQTFVTYSTLDSLASSIAQILLLGKDSSGPYVAAPDQIVAILLPRVSVHIFAAQLGALKACAGVLMLDTNLPDSVLQFQMSDSKPVAVLTLECYVAERARQQNISLDEMQKMLFVREHIVNLDAPIARSQIPTLDLDAVFRGAIKPNTGGSGNKSKVMSLFRPSNLAMVIYTSGTTGKPKAVLCAHAGYVNYTLDYCNYMNLMPHYDTHGQMASLSFDASLEELYGAWCAGIPLVVFTDSQIRSGPDLVPLLCREGVTAVSLVPSLLSTISRHPERDFPYPLLRYITVGGEAITESLVEPWTRGRRELVNSYGPTEATIVICRRSLRSGEPVTIGTPVANTTLFCIDYEAIENNPKGAPLRVLPHGSSGELCCAGIQVAHGYLNRDELTAEKFTSSSATQYGRTYRTGDLCCIDQVTKQIVYQGRIDQQVKIRGNRIELGTVETALLDELRWMFVEVDKSSNGAATLTRDDPIAAKQGDILVGFLCVPNYFQGKAVELECVPRDLQTKCKESLSKVLPPAAVPSLLVFISQLPRQVASGKINRKALPNVLELVAGSADLAAKGSAENNADATKDGWKTASGYIAGTEIKREMTTIKLAKGICNNLSLCAGFYFQGPQTTSEDQELEIIFCQTGDVKDGWKTYTSLLREEAPEADILRDNPLAQKCLQACREFLPALMVTDEFVKAGADSIMIAKLVGALRDFMPSTTVSDIISFKTLGKLMLAKLDASRLAKEGSAEDSDKPGDVQNDTLDSRHCVCHPYIFSVMQCFFLLTKFVIMFFVMIATIVFMLDLYDYLVVEILPQSIADDFALSALVLFPVMALVFVLADAVAKLVIAFPLYRLLWCYCIGHCCMGLRLGIKYRKWSTMHLYLWVRLSYENSLRSNIIFTSSDDMFSLILRCLGAKIGKDAIYGEKMRFDMMLAGFVNLGRGCIMGPETSIATVKMGQDHIIVGPIVLEDRVKVGARSYIGVGARVRQGCFVDHITSVDSAIDVEYQIISGVPGVATGIAASTLPLVAKPQHRRWRERELPMILHVVMTLLIIAIGVYAVDAAFILIFRLTWPFDNEADFHKFFLSYDKDEMAEQQQAQKTTLILPTNSTKVKSSYGKYTRPGVSDLDDWQSAFMKHPAEIFFVHWMPMAVYGAFVLTILYTVLFFVGTYGILRNPLLRIRVGCYPRRSIIGSLARAKMKLFNYLQKELFGYNSKPYMMSAAGCTFEPSCGCSELATCVGLLPDTTVIGSNSFWADDCVCTQVDFEGCSVKISRSRFPQNFFMGNSAVIEPASHATNYLVGVGTVAYAHASRRQMQTRLDSSVTIFGIPPVVISSDRVARFMKDKGNENPTEAAEPLRVEATKIGEPTGQPVIKQVSAERRAQEHMGEFAYEPTFCQFLFRGWLFDGSMKFMKFFPLAILLTILAFWLFNDFTPVYDAMSVQKSLYGKKGGGWRDKSELQGVQDDVNLYSSSYNWTAYTGKKPGQKRRLQKSGSGGGKGNQKSGGKGNQGTNPGGANSKAGGKSERGWKKPEQPERLFFLATEELFLLDRPTFEMVEVHLLLVFYIVIWSVAVPLLFVILKWLFVCRMKPGPHSLFANEVQRHFFIWTLAEVWMEPFLAAWNGTLVANFYYTLLGAKIGWRTLILQIGGYGDIDQWVIGNDCVVEGYVWQSHTFEDRVFWVEKTLIGDRCYVGKDSVLMGGSHLGNDSKLAPLSCAWKMMKLTPGTREKPVTYQGSPPVSSS